MIIAVSSLHAETTIALIEAKHPTNGWSFDNGREFPGAKEVSCAANFKQCGMAISHSRTQFYTDNPVFTTNLGGVEKGINILLGDGHVEWRKDGMAPLFNNNGYYYFSPLEFKDPYPEY